MSYEVDNRVVRMQFDNEDFERRVKQSRQSLDDLKKATSFETSSNGIKNLQNEINKLDISNISSGIGALEKRFSAFGTFAGRIIENVADSAYNMISRTLTAIPRQITQGGWGRTKNIAFAKFMLQGQDFTEDAAQDLINNQVDLAVTGTPYGLDEAAKVASQLVASGIDFEKSFDKFAQVKKDIDEDMKNAGDSFKITEWTDQLDDLSKALLAVSGTAAMTNSSYSEIGDIFATVRSMGKLTAYQLNQFAARGLNLRAPLAEYLGVAEEDMADIIHDGGVSFDDLVNVAFENFADQAKKANSTIDGALANMKASLSRIGQFFTTPIHDNLIGIYNDLRLLFDQFRNFTRDNISAKWTEFINRFAAGVRLIIQEFTSGNVIKNFMQIFVNFARVVGSFVLPVIRGLASAFSGTFSKFSYQNMEKSFLNIANAVAKWELTAEKQKKIQDTVGKGMSLIIKVVKALVKWIKDLAGGVSKLFKSIKTNHKITIDVQKVLQTVEPILKKVVDYLKDLGKTIAEHLPSLNQVGNFLKDAAGFLAVIAILIYNKIKPALEVLGQFFSGAWEGIKGWAGSLSDYVQKVKEAASNTDSLTETLGKIKDIKVMPPELPKIGKVLDNVKKKVKSVHKEIKTKAKDTKKTFKTNIISVFEKIKSINIGDHLLTIASGIFAAYMAVQALGSSGPLSMFMDFLQNMLGISKGVRGFDNFLTSLGKGLEVVAKAFSRQLNVAAVHSFVIALLELIAGIVVLTFLPQDKMLESVMLLVGVGALLLYAVKIIGKSIGPLESIKSANIAGTLVGLSFALLLLAGAFAIFASIDFKDMDQARQALGIFLLVANLLAVAAGIIFVIRKKYGASGDDKGSSFVLKLKPYITLFSNKNQFKMWGVNVLAFVTGLKMLFGIIKAVSQEDWSTKIGRAALGVGIVLGLVVAMAAAMKKWGSGQGLAFAALGLIGITAALSLIMGMAYLISRDEKHLKSFYKTIGVITFLLAGMLGIMGLLAKMFKGEDKTLSVNLLSFAAALIVFYAAINLFAKKDFGEVLTTVLAISSALIIFGITLSVIGLMADTIDKGSKAMFKFAAALTSVTLAIALVVAAIIAVGYLSEPIQRGIQAVCDAILQTIEYTIYTIGNLVLDLWIMIAGLFGKGEKAKAAKETWANSWSDTLVGAVRDGNKKAKEKLDKEPAVETDQKVKVKPDVEVEDSDEKDPKGKGGFKGFFGGFKSKINDWISKHVPSAEELVPSFSGLSGNLTTALGTSMTGVDASSLTSGFESLIGQGAGGVDFGEGSSVNEMLSSMGVSTDSVFATSLTENSADTVVPATEDIVDDINNTMTSEEAQNSYIESTKSTLQGFLTGLKDKVLRKLIKDEASSIATDIDKSYNTAMDQHSPSRLMSREAQNSGMGIIVGLQKMRNPIRTAAGDVADTAYNSMSNSLSSLNALVSSDIDANPTIAPVLDLTNVQNGVNGLNSMMNSGMLRMDSTATLASVVDASGVNGFTQSLSKSNQSISKDTIKAIGEIRGNISELQEAILRMGIYINGGALVGQIVDGIDTQLGIRQGYKGRNM